MSKAERQRPKKLQKSADSEDNISVTLKKLTLHDLLFALLRHDETLRTLIRDIVARPDTSAESDDEQVLGTSLDEPADKHGGQPPRPVAPPTPPAIDALRQQLAPELELLQAVRSDAGLSAEWLGEQPEDEGRQLLRLVACAAQWDLLTDLWDKLANRCKQGQRAASPNETHILRTALALHNLRWKGRQARLVEVATGTAFHYEHHQRGTATGEKVRALWLPGLVNAGGQMLKMPLVQT